MAKPQPSHLGKYQLSAREDAPDFRDFVYQPALVNLKPRLAVPKDLNIRDQGQEGACTGFGLAAVIDRLIKEREGKESKRKAKGKDITVSARMLYEMAQRYDEWKGTAYEGSSCRGAIKGWYNMGVCQEALYPYAKDERTDFTIAAAKDARNFHLTAPAGGTLEFAPTRHWTPGAGYRVHLTWRQVTKLDASK